MSVVDDLRLFQDLRRSSYDRLRWREERHGQSIDDRTHHDHECLYVYTENCRLGFEAGRLSSLVPRLSNECYPPPTSIDRELSAQTLMILLFDVSHLFASIVRKFLTQFVLLPASHFFPLKSPLILSRSPPSFFSCTCTTFPSPPRP
jgi:hypothetical protein